MITFMIYMSTTLAVNYYLHCDKATIFEYYDMC